MSDLHRAVQAELESHLPERTPPFADLQSRRRRRDRRRAMSAVALSVAAVLGIVVVPAALGRAAGPAQQATGDAETFMFGINWAESRDYTADVDASLIEECFALPGVGEVGAATSLPPSYSGEVSGERNAESLRRCVSQAAPGAELVIDGLQVDGPREFSYSVRWTDRPTSYSDRVLQDLEDECLDGEAFTSGMVAQSLPPVVSGRVAGRENADALEACVRRYAPGSTLFLLAPALIATVTEPVRYGLSYNDSELYDAAAEGVLQPCLNLPGVSDVSVMRSLPPQYRATVTGSPENAKFRACLGGSVPNVLLRELGPAPAPEPAPSGAPTVLGDPTGATICLNGYADDLCRRVDTAAANSLARVINGAEPLQATDVQCRSLAEAFLVTFEHPAAEQAPIEVSKGCGPLIVGADRYVLDASIKAAVARAYEAGSPIRTEMASGVSLEKLRADCGDAGQIVVMGVVRSPSEVFEDGLRVELRADGAKLGDAAVTAPEFTIRNANPSGLPEAGQVVLVGQDGATLAVENVSLRTPPGVICR